MKVIDKRAERKSTQEVIEEWRKVIRGENNGKNQSRKR